MPKGTEVTPAKLFSFFIERVRANLHLVLCFSPIGERFRQRAMKFPGLINEVQPSPTERAPPPRPRAARPHRPTGLRLLRGYTA